MTKVTLAEARRQANEILRDVEEMIRKEYGEPNALAWARDNTILARMILLHGRAKVDSVLQEDINWRLDRKLTWDVPGFASRFPRAVQSIAIRKREWEVKRAKEAEQRGTV